VKFCFLILSAPYSPWDKLLDNCAKKTWLANLNHNHSFFSYTGKEGPLFLGRARNSVINTKIGLNFWRRQLNPIPKSVFDSESSIRVDIFDNWDLMTVKFLSALQLINETLEYDFLVKVNTTTYVNVPSLEKALLSRMRKPYWGGAVSKTKPFTSGWATILSKDVTVRVVLEAIKLGSESFPPKYEDEAIGVLLSKLNLRPEAIGFREINKHTDIRDTFSFDTPLLRIKAQSNRQSIEPDLFRALHERLQSD